MSRNEAGTQQRRSRTMKRTFILLHLDDTLSVLKAPDLHTLESTGRIKEKSGHWGDFGQQFPQ